MLMKNLDGGFTEFREITEEEKQMFDKVMESIVGMVQIPLAVATQVVAGVNYTFLCNAKLLVPHATPQNDLVTIYKPLQGEPMVTSIRPIDILKIM